MEGSDENISSKIYKLKEEVMRRHEYETPQWVSWKVTASSEYGSWVESAITVWF